MEEQEERVCKEKKTRAHVQNSVYVCARARVCMYACAHVHLRAVFWRDSERDRGSLDIINNSPTD